MAEPAASTKRIARKDRNNHFLLGFSSSMEVASCIAVPFDMIAKAKSSRLFLVRSGNVK